MKRIRFVVFGLRNLVISAAPDSSSGKCDPNSDVFTEFARFIRFLKSRDVQPVVFANHEWTFGDKKKPAKDLLTKAWGEELPWFTAQRDGIPFKPQAGAMQGVLAKLGAEPNEILYIGNSEDDMRTAVNGGVLFLNGVWFRAQTKYGFKFASPLKIARFIDVCCLREHAWSFEIERGDLRYYSLAPFSTFKAIYSDYSEDAKTTAKTSEGSAEFWGPYICATLYLTGLYKEIDVVCPFPSYRAHTWKDPLQESIMLFAKCFRKSYCPDLIVRHTESLKAQYNPDEMDHRKHLDTIHLNRTPMRTETTRYKRTPLHSNRTVLVVDDFCTRGFSLEAARGYLQKAGVRAINLSWLKTINRPYTEWVDINEFDFAPYEATDWSDAEITVREHSYHYAMTDDEAYAEVDAKLEAFKTWSWPKGL